MHGICNIAAIPLRANPSHRAEMVSQLLFGETYSIIQEKDDWYNVKTCDYEGWIEKKIHNPLHEKDVDDYLNADKYVVRDLFLLIKDFETNICFPIFAGSSFPYPQNDMLFLGNSIFVVKLPEEKKAQHHDTLSDKQVALMQFASIYLHAPYLWGGRTPVGIDCSAFVQIAFKSIGITLPRDASQQVSLGDNVDFINEIQVGDVAFFENEENKIIHTGIICAPDKIIHVSGKVKIDNIDQSGIYSKEFERYTHHLRVIKRLL